jgi:FAD/FMN-containing dehydrogenase
MLVSVRGGGHHIAGNAVAEGGLMIDLSGSRQSVPHEPQHQAGRPARTERRYRA